jgi:hypothetical protein
MPPDLWKTGSIEATHCAGHESERCDSGSCFNEQIPFIAIGPKNGSTTFVDIEEAREDWDPRSSGDPASRHGADVGTLEELEAL